VFVRFIDRAALISAPSPTMRRNALRLLRPKRATRVALLVTGQCSRTGLDF
jgi:hypothetical protein